MMQKNNTNNNNNADYNTNLMKKNDIVIINGITYRIKKVVETGLIRIIVKEESLVNYDELKRQLNNETLDSPAECIARWFIETKKVTHGYLHSVKFTKVETAKNVIRRLHQLDGYGYMEILLTLSAALKDDFWKDVVLTCSGLRTKRKGKQTWFDMIRAKIYKINSDDNKELKQRQSVMQELK